MKTTIFLLLALLTLAFGAAIPADIANNPTFYSETPNSPHEFLASANSPSDPFPNEPKNHGISKRKCTGNFPYQTCYPSTGSRLAPPRLLTLPTLMVSAIVKIPGTLAAAIPSVDSLIPKALKTRLHKNEEAEGLEKRKCTGQFPYQTCWHSAGSRSLAPPRILALPTYVFSTLANLPHTLAAAIPTPRLSIKDGLQALYEKKQTVPKEKRKCTGQFPYQTCWHSASSHLAPPRILSLPTLLFTTLANLPHTLAAAIPDPSLVLDAFRHVPRAENKGEEEKRGVKSYEVAGKVLDLVERSGGWYFHELSSEAAGGKTGEKGSGRVLKMVVGLVCAGIGGVVFL